MTISSRQLNMLSVAAIIGVCSPAAATETAVSIFTRWEMFGRWNSTCVTDYRRGPDYVLVQPSRNKLGEVEFLLGGGILDSQRRKLGLGAETPIFGIVVLPNGHLRFQYEMPIPNESGKSKVVTVEYVKDGTGRIRKVYESFQGNAAPTIDGITTYRGETSSQPWKLNCEAAS